MLTNKLVIILMTLSLVSSVFLIVPNYTEAAGLEMRINLLNSQSSFLSESSYDYTGYSIAGSGDVNGDGYDDILIGAYGNDRGGSNSGAVFLVFGSGSGRGMDFDLTKADVCFVGEVFSDYSGFSTSMAGDVNGDGFDDILIGSPYNDEGGNKAGQVYLIFGKA